MENAGNSSYSNDVPYKQRGRITFILCVDVKLMTGYSFICGCAAQNRLICMTGDLLADCRSAPVGSPGRARWDM
jgi:hypothetical protein